MPCKDCNNKDTGEYFCPYCKTTAHGKDDKCFAWIKEMHELKKKYGSRYPITDQHEV